MTITPPKKKALRNALELKLRRCKGTRLQEFLAALMVKVHGDSFVPVGTDYSRGDLQCDGMLLEPMTIFACYGPVNAGANSTQASMKTAEKKVEDDFNGAIQEWPALKAWVFVHNYIEVPAQILHKIVELRNKHPDRQIYLFGKEQFENELLGLDIDAIEELIGDAATEEDFRSLQPAEVYTIVSSIVDGVDHRVISDDTPIIVPEKKLHFNGLSWICKQRIVDGMQNAKRVETLLQDHPNPLLDASLAAIFKAKYLDLKTQFTDPDEILLQLYEFSCGGEKTGVRREVAVWSLLAHLFEKCTVFEDAPIEAVA